jgi:ESF2/ABP1 family protein
LPIRWAAWTAAERSKGLVHLASVPPAMKPSKVRSLLAPWGALGRLYLSPEDPAAWRRRVKAGGN